MPGIKYTPPKPKSIKDTLDSMGMNPLVEIPDQERDSGITLETALEFARYGAALNVEQIIPRIENNYFGSRDVSIPQNIPDLLDLVSTPGTLIPSILNRANEEPNNLTTKNFLFCEPQAPVVLLKDDCPTCVKDPTVITVDWKIKENGFEFFNQKECRYSIVIDTGLIGMPSENDKDYYIKKGIELLIRKYEKSDIISVVSYVPNYTTSFPPYYEGKLRQALEYAEQSGKFAGQTLGGRALDKYVMLSLPPGKRGFDRILEEFNTVEELFPDAKSNTIVYVPIDRNMTTKLLVAINYAIFDAVPARILSKPELDLPKEQANFKLECTLMGYDLSPYFNFVARNLKIASRYLDNLQAKNERSVFYIVNEQGLEIPYAYDPYIDAERLLDFYRNTLKQAIRKVLNVPLSEVETVIIGFDKQEIPDPIYPYKKLVLKEVTVNKFGCPQTPLSPYIEKISEVRDLFQFNNQTVLGYVAALPDMETFLRGVTDPNWIEFLAKFTYPGLVVKDPSLLLITDEPESVESTKCLIETPLSKLANLLIAGASGLWRNSFGSLQLGSLNESLCHTPDDSIQQYKASKEQRQKIKKLYFNLKASVRTNNEKIRSLKDKVNYLSQKYASSGKSELFRDSLNDTLTQIEATRASNVALNRIAKFSKQLESGEFKLTNQEAESLGFTREELGISDLGNNFFESDFFRESEKIALKKERENKRKDKKEIFKQQFNDGLLAATKSERERLKEKPFISLLLKLILPKAYIDYSEDGLEGVPDVEYISSGILEDVIIAIDAGGGWCSWIKLFSEASGCIAKGLGPGTAKEAILRAALGGLDSYQFEKIFRSLPPETRNTIRNSLKDVVGNVTETLFVWETDWEVSRVFDADKAISERTEEIVQEKLTEILGSFEESLQIDVQNERNLVRYWVENLLPTGQTKSSTEFKNILDLTDTKVYKTAEEAATAGFIYSLRVGGNLRQILEKSGLLSNDKNTTNGAFSVDQILSNEQDLTSSGTATSEIIGYITPGSVEEYNLILKLRKVPGWSAYYYYILTKINEINKFESNFYQDLYDYIIKNFDPFTTSYRQDSEEFENLKNSINSYVEKRFSTEKASDYKSFVYENNDTTKFKSILEKTPKGASVYKLFDLQSGQRINFPTVTEMFELVSRTTFYYYKDLDFTTYDSGLVVESIKILQDIKSKSTGKQTNDYIKDKNNNFSSTFSPAFDDTIKLMDSLIKQIGDKVRKTVEESLSISTATIEEKVRNFEDLQNNSQGLAASLTAGSQTDQTRTELQKFLESQGLSSIEELQELSREQAVLEVEQLRKEFVEKRLERPQSALIGNALGALGDGLFDAFTDTLIKAVGVDQLLDILDEIPGIGIVKNFIKDSPCLLPEVPLVVGGLTEGLKTLKVDLCNLVAKKPDFSLPKLDPPRKPSEDVLALRRIARGGSGQSAALNAKYNLRELRKNKRQQRAERRKEELAEFKLNAKSILKLLLKTLKQFLVDLMTQFLIRSMVGAIEATLDTLCNVVALGAASLADLVSTNKNFRDRLKESMCPGNQISESQFINGLSNILEAVYGANPGARECVTVLANSPELASFIDSVIVTLTYNQLVDLVNGTPSAQTLQIVSQLALTSGSECVANIFGDPQAVADFWKGIGVLIDAPSVFTSVPTDAAFNPTAGICPPNTFDLLDNVRRQLLTEKGLTPEEIQDQLDLLKESAAQKLEDLYYSMLNGPFDEIPSIVGDDFGDDLCPPSGLIIYSPEIETMSRTMLDTILDPVETRATKDLIGPKGALSNLLSDTMGRNLQIHKFYVENFGNSQGQFNTDLEFYSNNFIKKSRIVNNQLVVEPKQRVDQFGITLVKEVFDIPNDGITPLVMPYGGYSPTVGAYLMNKYQNSNIGYVFTADPTVAQAYRSTDSTFKQPKVTFKTKRTDLSLVKKKNQLSSYNDELIRQRKQYVALFCLVSGFIDAKTAEPYIFLNDKPSSIPNGEYEGLVEYTNKVKSEKNYEDRLAFFQELILNCSGFIFDENYVDKKNDFVKRLGSILDSNQSLIGGNVISGIAQIRSFVFNLRTWYALYNEPLILKEQKEYTEKFGSISASGLTKRDDGIWVSSSPLPWQFQFENYIKYLNIIEFTYPSTDPTLPRTTPIDSDIKPLPDASSFEIGMTYLTYPKMTPSLGKKKDLAPPEWGFELNYELTLEDENGVLIPNARNSYKVSLIEKLNPFNANSLSRADREKINQYNLDSLKVLQSASTGNPSQDIQNDGSGPNSYPVYAGQGEVSLYDRVIEATIEEDVDQKVVEYLRSTIDYNNPASTENGVFIQSDVSIEIGNQTFEKEPIIIDPLRVKYSFQSEAFRVFILDSISKYTAKVTTTNKLIDDKSKLYTNDLFDAINSGLMRRLSKRIGNGDKSFNILEFDDSDNPVTLPVGPGFKFGYDSLKLPEVIILDPVKYGGDEQNPPYYIKPPEYDGWLGILQKMFPEEDGCEPKNVPITSFKDIKEETNVLISQLRNDERLGFEATCTQEAPYDAIFEGSSLAVMDAIIRATARTSTIEMVLRTIPVISQFKIDFNENFDELLLSYMADRTLKTLKTMDRNRRLKTFQRKILINPRDPKDFIVTGDSFPKLTFYYGFLEQSVNIVLKKINEGLIDEATLTQRQKEALSSIRTEIERYYVNYEGTEAVLSEEAIQSQSILKRAINSSILRGVENTSAKYLLNFDKVRAKRIKNGLTYAILEKTEEQAKVIFELYFIKELEYVQKILNDKFQQSVDSLDLLFLSDPEYVNGAVTKVLDEVTGEVSGYTGPYDVQSDPTDKQTCNIDFFKFSDISGELANEALKNSGKFFDSRWPFVLEKYIIIEDKNRESFADQTIADKILNRDIKLKGVVNLQDWENYIKEISVDPQLKNYKISDLFGNTPPELVSTIGDPNFGKTITNNPGWKFGLRLSMVFGEDSQSIDKLPGRSEVFKEIFFGTTNNTSVFSGNPPSQEEITLSKGLIIETNFGTQALIPIANGELSLKDIEISSYSSSQYDLICLVKELRESLEFRTLFSYFFPHKRYLSLLTMYTMNSFFDSVGNADRPSKGGDRWTYPNGKALSSFRNWDKNNVFYDPNIAEGSTLESLMLSFLTVYKTRNKFLERSDIDGRVPSTPFKDLFANIKNVMTEIKEAVESIPLALRKNKIERPFDGFENECSDFEDVD